MGISDFLKRIKDNSKQETVDSSLTNVDPMGNYVGNYGTLTAEEDRKVKVETEQRRQAEEARGESDAETQRLLRQNAAAGQAIAAAAEDKKLADEKANQAEQPVKKDVGPPRDNPLFKYADYTYGLSLHIIPPATFNKMAKDPNYVYIPVDDKGNGTVLIASAGRRDAVKFKRHAEFNEDFYFDNLKFTTVTGLNARTRNTNSIDVSFSIIEPYGVTLLNRLLSVADQLETKSWMQMPFMLQIDFFGNSDQGDLLHPIPDQTKYIPIRLIACKIKITSRGAEYQIQGIPFTHQAFQESMATTPAFFEVQAKTVNDFFSSGGSAGDIEKYNKVKQGTEERSESLKKQIDEEEKKNPKGTRQTELAKELRDLNQNVSQMSYVVGSYTAAMNSFQNQLKSANYQNVDIYEFKFDPLIGNSDIVIPKKTDIRRTPMNNPATKEGIAAIRAQAGLPTAGLNLSAESFSINAGTSIIDVVNLVMRNSKYIRDQITDPAVDGTGSGQDLADKLKKPINWYKIVPVIELLEFDNDRQLYAKKLTYHVVPFTYYNSKFKDAPKAIPDAYAKEYDYMYTGKNQSIINFDIDFDTMFYTAITANRSNLQASANQKADQENKTDESKTQNKNVSVQDNSTRYIAGSANVQNPQSPDSKGVLVNDLNKSMLSSSRGDMINVKLKIIGDPEFIKQDDVFFNPENNPTQRQVNFVDPRSNSIVFDAAEVFCKLLFRTPKDYDPESGLMKFEKVETSVFSGIYKLITVENEFSRGQFTQNLNLIRLFDQPDFDTLAGKAHNNTRSMANRLPETTTVAETQGGTDPSYADFDIPVASTTPVAQSTPDESDTSSSQQFNQATASLATDYTDNDAGYQTRQDQSSLRADLDNVESDYSFTTTTLAGDVNLEDNTA